MKNLMSKIKNRYRKFKFNKMYNKFILSKKSEIDMEFRKLSVHFSPSVLDKPISPITISDYAKDFSEVLRKVYNEFVSFEKILFENCKKEKDCDGSTDFYKLYEYYINDICIKLLQAGIFLDPFKKITSEEEFINEMDFIYKLRGYVSDIVDSMNPYPHK